MRPSFSRLSLAFCLISLASLQISSAEASSDPHLQRSEQPIKRRLSPQDHDSQELLFPRRVTRTAAVATSSSISSADASSTTLKSLFRSQQNDASSDEETYGDEEEADPDTVDPQHAVLRRQDTTQTSAFCTKYKTSCEKVCSSHSKSVSTSTCMSKVSGGYAFKCSCSGMKTDYTNSALANAASSVVVAAQAVTLTSTVTNTVTSTVSTTSTVVHSATVTTTSLETSTRLRTATTTPPASSVTVTSTSTSPAQTVTNTATTTRAPTTTTITKVATVDGGTTTTTVVVAAAAASAKVVGSSGSQLIGMSNSSAVSLGRRLSLRDDATSSSCALSKRATTFCSMYKTSCTNQCASHSGVSSESCSTVSTNVYSFACKCKDGTTETLHAMNSIASTTTTTSTKIVTVTVTATVTSTRTFKATATSTSTVVVVSTTRAVTSTLTTTAPAATNTQTVVVSVPATSTVTVQSTTTVPATSTATATTTSTVTGAKTTVTVTSTTTSKTSTTTKASSATTSSTKTTTSTSAKAASATASTGFLQVADASTGQVYGLVNPNLDSNAYSFTLDDTSSNGIKVSMTKSSLSTSLVSLLMANQTVVDYYQPYNYVGLETVALSDTGLQPTLNEYLILTDVSQSTSSLYPSKSSSDSGGYYAEAVAWSYNSATQKITPVWTNAKSSTPTSATMQLWMLCASQYDDCFLAAAYNSSVWTAFDTDSVSLTQVTFTFVPST